MKDRIRQIMESQHMSQQVFAGLIKVSPATLSSIFNERTKPTLAIVDNIKQALPQLNTDWLLFGAGEMFGSQGQASPTPSAGAAEGTQLTLDFGEATESGAGGTEPGQPRPQAADQSAGGAYGAGGPAAPQPPAGGQVREVVKYVERPQRQITEIRIYFDDQTFETFLPEKR